MTESEIVGRRLEVKVSVTKTLRNLLKRIPDAKTLDSSDIAWCWGKAKAEPNESA